MKLFTVIMLMMFSMGVNAKVDVELNKEYKGGKVEVKSQEDNPDGSTLVTITVTPDQGFTITHSDKDKGVIVVAVRPTGSQSGTRAPQIAGDLDVKGPTENVSYPNSADYQFTVPAGLNAWVQDIKFQKKESGAKASQAYTFYVINNNEKESVKGTKTVETTSTALDAFKAIATNIVSPFILDDNYYFYDTEEDAIDATGLTNGGGNGSSTVEDIDVNEDRNIYVRYYYDASLSPIPIDLSGSVQYNIMIGGQYFADNVSRYRPETRATGDVTEAALLSDGHTNNYHFLWKLTGNDPYNIALTSTYTPGDRFLWGQWKNNGGGSESNMYINNGVDVNVVGGNNATLGTTILSTNLHPGSKGNNLASFILLPHSSGTGYVLMAATTSNQPNGSNQYAYQSKNTNTNPWVRFASAASAEVVSLTPRTKCDPPTITYDNTTGEVTIESTTTGAAIYYTVDGSTEPSSSETRYTAPFNISAATTIKAIAIKADRNNSDVSTEIISKLSTPTITVSGSSIIITADNGTTIHYTTGGTPPTMGSSVYSTALSVTDYLGETIQAIAVKAGSITSDIASQTVTLTCAQPVISVDKENKKFSITCSEPTSGVTIYYTIDESDPSASATREIYRAPVVFDDYGFTVKAIAVADGGGYSPSVVAEKYIQETLDGSGTPGDPYRITSSYDYGVFVNMVNYDWAGACYLVTADNISASGTITATFTGTFDGGLHAISGLSNPLFPIVYDGTVKNVILDNVSISSGTNVGAICGEATGDTRIYNCGVLATNSTATTDKEGYTAITSSSCSSTISGSGYVGGIVGLLDDNSRVINCFSYANITGGNVVGGIVGRNNIATSSTDLHTMVMNCIFYGDITSGSSKAPVYNGVEITNDGDANGVNNFNYFWADASYVKDKDIDVYNCALSAETRFLQRFEFFRHLLNSNRELAAWWASTSTTTLTKEDMMKWVMEPSQIGTSTPYPILKSAGKYASVVNYTPSDVAYDNTETNRNKGLKLTQMGGTGTDAGKLSVTIRMGSNTPYGAPTGAGLKPGFSGTIDLIITDKDFEHFNFNYGKVQLPYYNDYCTGNYTQNRVVTGWKIVSITGGTPGKYSTGADATYKNGELTATPYNFADRNCTAKDLYSGSNATDHSGRIFNQGAYWDVPVGVTAITIEPYWGKAVYLSDANWDVTYKNGTGTDANKADYQDDAMTTAVNVPYVGGGQRYDNGVSTFNGQLVYTSIGNAIASSGTGMALFQGVTGSPGNQTVYDYAVVLVGNYHHNGDIEATNDKPYTVTSVDLDGDNEPDYSFMLRFNDRKAFHPVRYDFLNLIGLGMAQKTTGGKGSYNFGIMQPKGWFEVTNTALFRVTQFEYDRSDRGAAPHILQGGVIEQWVSGQNNGVNRQTIYFHLGGNVWFKEFQLGTHIDKTHTSKHPPISVTGGDFDEFYLTGLYRGDVASYDDNAECYINGGRFGVLAGAGQEGLGNATNHTNGNITWQIDNADVTEFYGGGFNQPIQGNINTVISNSHVDQFCGGPKFGDMNTEKTVKTTATNCTFGKYFGAGFGGNAYSREAPSNVNNIVGDYTGWNTWVNQKYTQAYSNNYKGVSTEFDYQYLPMSNNTQNVARIFIDYVRFSLATTHEVTSLLTDCHITGNFYGGGNLGKVEGSVTSTLTNCTVNGSVFGAGYSASTPKVDVMNTGGFTTPPFYDENLGAYLEPVFPLTVQYTWDHKDNVNSTANAIDKTNHILYTTENLTTLGTVTGNVTLTIDGTTTVAESVYGGGEESAVNKKDGVTDSGNIIVTLKDNAQVYGNVFGGGNKGLVEGSATVNIGQTTSTSPEPTEP